MCLGSGPMVRPGTVCLTAAPSCPVFLQNKARREDFCPRKLRQMHLMIDQLMAHSHLRYKGEHPELLVDCMPLPRQDPQVSLPGCQSPPQLIAQAAAGVSAFQGHCPCYSATSSQGCRPTSWMLRSTCSWCPSWTVTLRTRTHLEQVELPMGRQPALGLGEF